MLASVKSAEFQASKCNAHTIACARGGKHRRRIARGVSAVAKGRVRRGVLGRCSGAVYWVGVTREGGNRSDNHEIIDGCWTFCQRASPRLQRQMHLDQADRQVVRRPPRRSRWR